MKYNRSNFAETTLGAAIANDSATAITVTSGTPFPAVPFLVTIGTEILKCTSKGTGEDWTVTRGEQSSVAAAHDNGTKVENNITADDLNIMAEAFVAVTQASHPFAAGDVIYCSGANTYAKANADAAATSDVVGVVSVDVGTDDFIYCASGKMTTGVPAVAAGSVLFLSDTTAGALTTTEPTAAGHISLPVAIVTENAVSMIVYSWRGMEIGTAGSGDVVGPASATDGNLAVFNGVSGKIIKDGGAVTAAGLALLDDANAAAQIATLGLDADIATLALPASTTISAAGAALIDDATAADQLTTLGALPKAGGTLSGDITLGENTAVALDPAGSADEKWSGITIAGTAGATLAVGDLCYLDVTAAEWLLADADAAATAGPVVLGICILAGNNADATNMLLMGTVRSAAFPASIALGAPVYVSATAGDITATAPSTATQIVRICGYAVTVEPNTLFFAPDRTWIEV
jgi:hypothetical protein